MTIETPGKKSETGVSSVSAQIYVRKNLQFLSKSGIIDKGLHTPIEA